MENQSSYIFKKSGVLFVAGFLGCLIPGYLFLGQRIFIPRDPAFQFITYGILGSVVFSILKYSSIRNFIYGTLFFLVLDVVLVKMIQVEVLFARIFYLLAIVFSIYLYHSFFFEHTPAKRYVKIFTLAGIIAIINLLLASLGALVINVPNKKEIIEGQSFFGLLIGIGLGVGFEIGDLINNSVGKRM